MRYVEFTSETEAQQYLTHIRSMGYKALMMKLNQQMYEVRVWA